MHPFKLELGGERRCLQPAPQDVQASGGQPGTLVSISKLAAKSEYYNPDSLVQVLGYANEAMVVVDGVETMALIDAGSKISALPEGFCTEMGLRTLPLRNSIGDGGISIPYKGYIDANLTIPN